MSLVVVHLPLLGSQQGRSSSCQGLLEDAARGVPSPPPPISPHPHTPLSLFVFERLEYHRIKRLQLCWEEKTSVTPQQFMDNFPLIRDNGVQLNGFAILHLLFEDMEGSLTAVCSCQQWHYHDFVYPIVHREIWTVGNDLTAC